MCVYEYMCIIVYQYIIKQGLSDYVFVPGTLRIKKKLASSFHIQRAIIDFHCCPLLPYKIGHRNCISPNS